MLTDLPICLTFFTLMFVFFVPTSLQCNGLLCDRSTWYKNGYRSQYTYMIQKSLIIYIKSISIQKRTFIQNQALFIKHILTTIMPKQTYYFLKLFWKIYAMCINNKPTGPLPGLSPPDFRFPQI